MKLLMTEHLTNYKWRRVKRGSLHYYQQLLGWARLGYYSTTFIPHVHHVQAGLQDDLTSPTWDYDDASWMLVTP
jgi:hypothetical protein